MCPIDSRTTQPAPLHVSRGGPRTIAEQIAEQLAVQMRTGRLRAGERLPPVRVLAGFLRVNRNTVAKVYAGLERGGYVRTTPGRGTFVAAAAPVESARTLIPQIDHLLELAAARGVGEADLRALLVERAGRHGRDAAPRVGFVECNPVDLAYFSRQLAARVRVPVMPVLLTDLSRAAGALDLVATTMFHVEDVRRRMPRLEVVGLMALPELSTLEAVAQLPARATVALVCATDEGVRSKERSIRAVGIHRPRLLSVTLQQPVKLAEALRRADVVLASPKVLERLADQIPRRARVIPFGSVLSEGAVAMLEERIRAWRPARSGGRRTSRHGRAPAERTA